LTLAPTIRRLSVLLTSSDQQTPLFYASKTGLRSCFFISLRENVRLSKTGGLFSANGWHFVNLPLT
ncbi:hypothetical protein, partial [Salmonella enterica]|uniref:hypothetical protein n=1 Tax=Salmonella enterica TaxID=28901 RepID=UPI0009AF9D64